MAIEVVTDMSVQDGKRTIGKTTIWCEDDGGFHQNRSVFFEGQSFGDLEEFLKEHRHRMLD